MGLLNGVTEEFEIGRDFLSQIPEEVIEISSLDEPTEKTGMKLGGEKRWKIIVGDGEHIGSIHQGYLRSSPLGWVAVDLQPDGKLFPFVGREAQR